MRTLRIWAVHGVVLICALSIYLPSHLSAQATKATKASGSSGEWPQFLGPKRNGISSETGLLDAWPADGPKEVFRVAGGVGMSGIVIRDGIALTMVQRDGQQRLVALNSQTGQSRWEAVIAPEYENQMGHGPRATPTIAGDKVFVFSGEGVLAAVQFADGKILWSKKVVSELGGKPADYGMACSPLVVGDQVIVTVGAPQATVAAFDATSGKKVWAAGSDPAGYSSPTILNVGGSSQIVAFTGGSALGLTPATGKVLWRFPYKTDFDCNIITPIEHEGRVFISSGENHGCVMLNLKRNGETFTAEPAWESQGTKSVFRNEWQTPILIDGYLYGFDNVGSAGPVTHLTCIDVTSGKVAWQKVRFGKGNLIAAEGKLLMSTMNGELIIARASPKGYEEIGRKTVIGSTRQAPALAGGLVYLRDDAEIVCLDIRRTAE